MGLIDLAQLGARDLAEGVRARIVHGEGLTVAHLAIDAGASMPEHTHPHEQIVNVVEGELELTVSGVPHTLTPGRVMVLAPSEPHAARAVTDVRLIDVFQPVREDLRYDE